MKVLVSALILVLWVLPAAAQATFVFGPDVTERQKRTITKAADKAQSALLKRYDFTPSPETLVIASSDPEFLAKAYSKARGLRLQPQYATDIDRWVFAIGFYRGMLLNLGSHIADDLSNVEGAVLHEFFHVMQFELFGSKSKRCCVGDKIPMTGPVWFTEGSADYFEASFKRSVLRNFLYFGKSTKRNLGDAGLGKMETLQDIRKVHGGYAIAAYAVSQLIKQSGEDAVLEYYRDLGRGVTWKTAFAKHFGITPDAFYEAF